MEIDRRAVVVNPLKRKRTEDISVDDTASSTLSTKRHKQDVYTVVGCSVFVKEECDSCQMLDSFNLANLRLCALCKIGLKAGNSRVMAQILDRLVQCSSDDTKAIFLHHVLKSLNLEFNLANSQLFYTCKQDEMDYIS